MLGTPSKIRSACIFFGFFTLFGTALIHLYKLQIKRHTFFADLAHRQYFLTVTSYLPRAVILDRNGLPLALNKESTSAFIMPHTIKDQPTLTTFLKKHFPQALEQWHAKPTSKFLYLKRGISDQELNAIQSAGLKDIHLLKEPNRFYPHQSAASIIGMTNIDNKGLFGLEYVYNDQLAGKPAKVVLEKDARSGLFYFGKTVEQEADQGKPLQVSLDAHLQFLVSEELNDAATKHNAAQAAALVMNPETGEILAIASYPTFDPTNLTLLEQEATKNTALTESYEFGSAFKAFSALAALDENAITLDEPINCEGAKTAYVAGRKINTVIPGGVMPFLEVMTTSNNIGIAKVAMRIDTKLYDHYKKLGFGTKTGIEFPGENKGSVNHPRNWSKHSIISLSYGYEVSSTLLQLARAFSIVSNGGYLVQPTLIKQDGTKKPTGTPLYSPAVIEQLRTILQAATSKHATGAKAKVHGYTTLGKTSTANLLENGVYNKDKNMYAFVGSVEKGDYKRTIACFIKESRPLHAYASTIAAPLFERIAEKTLIHEKMW